MSLFMDGIMNVRVSCFQVLGKKHINYHVNTVVNETTLLDDFKCIDLLGHF